jgi:hypothetical protein
VELFSGQEEKESEKQQLASLFFFRLSLPLFFLACPFSSTVLSIV